MCLQYYSLLSDLIKSNWLLQKNKIYQSSLINSYLKELLLDLFLRNLDTDIVNFRLPLSVSQNSPNKIKNLKLGNCVFSFTEAYTVWDYLRNHHHRRHLLAKVWGVTLHGKLNYLGREGACPKFLGGLTVSLRTCYFCCIVITYSSL